MGCGHTLEFNFAGWVMVNHRVITSFLVFASAMLMVSCGAQSYSDQEVSEALADMKPLDPGVSWSDYMLACTLESGISVEVIVDSDGSVTMNDASERDKEIMQACTDEASEVFIFPEVSDRRLANTAMYQLQVRAAECIQTRLGLDPSLPTLERYVDTDGDWNMYDTLTPSSSEEWLEWNEVCPQDLWHYYLP